MMTQRPKRRSQAPLIVALLASLGLIAALISSNATTKLNDATTVAAITVLPLTLPPVTGPNENDTPRSPLPNFTGSGNAALTEHSAVPLTQSEIAPPTSPTVMAIVPSDRDIEEPVESSADGAPSPAVTTAPTPRVTQVKKPEPGHWESTEVRRGDTLSGIFKRLGQTQRTLHEMLLAGAATKPLQRLRPGQLVRIRVAGERLHELRYTIDPLTTLQVIYGPDGWRAQQLTTPVERRTRYVGGTIDDSFYASALRAGLDDRLIMEMAGIFGWDIDFSLDIRTGDRFTVLHEELYDDQGNKLLDGAILAAGFTNRAKTFHAVRFTAPDGSSNFFDPEGYAMRKAFLRSPVDFRRISSRFRTARNHPVLGVKRPHRGVDYAAATGTPIKAAGDGKVVHVGKKGGYGKTVILRHGGRYQTLYAHMSRYARGMRSGRRVSQGEVIGHVGATGLATGPHLHYEFLVDGVHRNPLTVSLPAAEPLAKEYLPAFRELAAPLIARLDLHERGLLAHSDSAGTALPEEDGR